MIRPFLLPVTLGALMSSVFLLPKAGSVAQSAINPKLPAKMGEWYYNPIPPSEKEVDLLAKDTDFSKAVCLAPNPGVYRANGEMDPKRIDLSVVISGADINNSIHRPERCMPSQGHQIYDAKSESIVTEKGKTFPARELLSMQTLQNPKTKAEVTLQCVTYYFFVGQHEITENHVTRTLIDMRDRITRGQDQRWAYVSASRWFSDKGEDNLPTREVAEKEIRQFLGNLADNNIDWEQIGRR